MRAALVIKQHQDLQFLLYHRAMAALPIDVEVFAHPLEHTGGYTPEEARRVAGTLLPDMLHYEPGRPAIFPSNGRTLTDDAGDAFLAVLTNGKVMEDKVGAHGDLLAEFPYLGSPHNARATGDQP